MRKLPQDPEHEEGRESVLGQAASGDAAGVLHRDSSQQLSQEEGGRRGGGLHQGGLQRR